MNIFNTITNLLTFKGNIVSAIFCWISLLMILAALATTIYMTVLVKKEKQKKDNILDSQEDSNTSNIAKQRAKNIIEKDKEEIAEFAVLDIQEKIVIPDDWNINDEEHTEYDKVEECNSLEAEHVLEKEKNENKEENDLLSVLLSKDTNELTEEEKDILEGIIEKHNDLINVQLSKTVEATEESVQVVYSDETIPNLEQNSDGWIPLPNFFLEVNGRKQNWIDRLFHVSKGDRIVIHTGIKLNIPEGHETVIIESINIENKFGVTLTPSCIYLNKDESKQEILLEMIALKDSDLPSDFSFARCRIQKIFK